LEFTRPAWLWVFVALPILAGVAHRGHKLRRHAWNRLGKTIFPRAEADWRWLIALGLLIFAAAGPRWNWRSGQGARTGQDIILVIDASRSMGATDALPNRMGTTITSAESLIRAIGTEQGGRVGVVAFAGRGVVRSPLTDNLGVVADAVKSIRPGSIQPGGTNIAAGVGLALDLLVKSSRDVPRSIVLFTDGEDHNGTWPALVARLRREKVTLHGVAVGDAETGHSVPTIGGKPLRFQGQVVESRRNDTPIEALAAATGGSILRLGLAPVDLSVLFERRIKPFAAVRREELRRTAERTDRHAPFVLAALALGASACRAGRIRSIWVVWPLLFALSGAAPLDRSTSAWLREGKAAYDRKDMKAARDLFDRAARTSPRSALAFYGAAATAFQTRHYAEALKLYQRSLDLTDDAGLRMKIAYALGNTHVALGNRSEAIKSYEVCMASTVPGPTYDAIRGNADVNKQFAEKMPPKPEPPENGGEQPDSKSGNDADDSNRKDRKGDRSENPGNTGAGSTSPSDAMAGDDLPEGTSPRERFQRALDTIRQARDFRPPTPGTAPSRAETLKDW
jgi:Ca-activated chloride channel family protein